MQSRSDERKAKMLQRLVSMVGDNAVVQEALNRTQSIVGKTPLNRTLTSTAGGMLPLKRHSISSTILHDLNEFERKREEDEKKEHYFQEILTTSEIEEIKDLHDHVGPIDSSSKFGEVLGSVGQHMLDSDIEEILQGTDFELNKGTDSRQTSVMSLNTLLFVMAKVKARHDESIVDDITAAFQALSSNTDSIEAESFKAITREFRLTLDVDRLVAEADEDGSGLIELGEFQDMIAKIRSSTASEAGEETSQQGGGNNNNDIGALDQSSASELETPEMLLLSPKDKAGHNRMVNMSPSTLFLDHNTEPPPRRSIRRFTMNSAESSSKDHNNNYFFSGLGAETDSEVPSEEVQEEVSARKGGNKTHSVRFAKKEVTKKDEEGGRGGGGGNSSSQRTLIGHNSSPSRPNNATLALIPPKDNKVVVKLKNKQTGTESLSLVMPPAASARRLGRQYYESKATPKWTVNYANFISK